MVMDTFSQLVGRNKRKRIAPKRRTCQVARSRITRTSWCNALPWQGPSALASANRSAGGQHAARNPCCTWQEIVARNLNAASVAQRDDLAKLNVQLETELAGKGFTFNRSDTISFRQALQKTGFYDEWRKKYGDEAWTLLEKYTNKPA
jgi:hypothetical protein